MAESGIVESITCFNFMCHQRLHVELGPLINFVVGENGSGKSAVLTALTLCLGGKASDTNRGGSLKTFVKEGQDHGSIVVKIKNAGTDAYQPDLYGESIIVERVFSRSGSSGFKIKSALGRIISTKKQEVDEICEWYALQIGNPLTVLSQDNARQFLNSASPAQKYKYFVSGVQLEQLDNDYKMSQDTLDKTLILREDLDSMIAEVKKEMEDAQRLAETAQKNQSLREKARLYRSQLVWSQVEEQERELEARSASLVEWDARIVQAEANCEEKTRALAEADAVLEQATAAKAALNDGWEPIDRNIADAEKAFDAAKKNLTELHHEERDAHGRLKNIKEDIHLCEKRIKKEEKRLNESTGSARVEKDAELTDARAREAELQQKLADATEQLPSLQEDLSRADQRLKEVQRAKDLKRKDIVAAEARVQTLEKSTGSPYDGFDRDIMNLVKAIDDDDGYDHKPLGPLGAHIKLRQPEWSAILEKTFGETLNAFVVRNKRDQTRLSGLIRTLNFKRPPPVYIAYGTRIETHQHEPDPSFDTILRVLEFADDVIRSQLVINHQIEKIILIKNRVEAEKVMIDSGAPPRNVAACVCFHDGKGKRGHGLRLTHRGGNISTAPVAPWPLRPRMQTDSGRQVALQRENLRQLGLELREVNMEERQAQQGAQRSKSELDSHRKSLKQLENDLRRAQADIEHVREELDAFDGVDDRLIALRSELERKQAEEAHVGQQYGNMRLAKRELGQKADEAKARLDQEREQKEEYQQRVNKAAKKILSAEDLRRIALVHKNDAFEALDSAKLERRRAEEKREQKRQAVEDFVQQASEVAPDRVHIPEGENRQSIEAKYQKLRAQLHQREQRLGATDQQIYDRATDATTRYEEVREKTQDVDETIAALKLAIEHRLHLWRQFQRQISARIRIQFSYLLSERGFRGKIELDHRQRKVNIQIEPDETRKSSFGRNTKTLSGGEKSFSSICMLLSVWEAIGSPIRCLDEFDVFMDNVNRSISTNMLVSLSVCTTLSKRGGYRNFRS